MVVLFFVSVIARPSREILSLSSRQITINDLLLHSQCFQPWTFESCRVIMHANNRNAVERQTRRNLPDSNLGNSLPSIRRKERSVGTSPTRNEACLGERSLLHQPRPRPNDDS